MNIKKILFGSDDSAAEEPVDIRTALAVILMEMAGADDEFDQQEERLVLQILQETFSLDDEAAAVIADQAREAREESVDLYRFTSRINRACSREEKLQMMDMLWEVIYSDGRLDGHEDHLIHRLTTMLNLDHRDMIESKLKAAAKHRSKG
ncbi:TerB family tellurite resistance protein [bacterium]|nr:TerB family tellurite resistance protein [bacterium]